MKHLITTKNNSIKRTLLFTFQSIIVTVLLALTAIAFFYYNNLYVEKGIKILFAPFLSVVPLLFILSILKDVHKTFKEGHYSKKEIIQFIIITALTTLIFTVLTFLLAQIDALEILLAAIIAILSAVIFLRTKVKNIIGMSIITGIAEGIIIYMIFIF